MTNEAKKFTVTILGNSYTIVSDESEKTIAHAASLVDAAMKEIYERNRSLDQFKAAVLVALKYATKLCNQEAFLQERFEFDQELIKRITHELESNILK